MAKTVCIGGLNSDAKALSQQIQAALPEQFQNGIDAQDLACDLEVATAIKQISAETRVVIFAVGCPFLAVGEVDSETESDGLAIKELRQIAGRTNDEHFEPNNRARLVRIVADILSVRAQRAIMVVTGWKAIEEYLLGALENVGLGGIFFLSDDGKTSQNLVYWRTDIRQALEERDRAAEE